MSHALARRIGTATMSSVLLLVAAQAAPVVAQEVPVPCVAGACGPGGPTTWVTSGSATGTSTGNSFVIEQQTRNATLNWRSFNIGANSSVEFRQPGSDAVALNRIYQADASRIFGSLRANGQVYLLNQNGVLFGQGSSVNVGGLLVTSLDLTPEALRDGLTSPSVQGRPALAPYAGATRPGGEVRIAEGAQIQTTEGGRVLVFAPTVTNEGRISTPGGQTVLGAGTQVYLAAPLDDPNLRGLLVEIDGGGTVTNGRAANSTSASAGALVGQIIAERGNVTLAGLAVNQLGRVSATTSVRAGGSIRLQSRTGGRIINGQASGGTGGSLVLGERSVTEVLLRDDSTETTVDVNTQPRSTVTIEGNTIDFLRDSRVTATGGRVNVVARTNWSSRPSATTGVPDDITFTPDSSRLYLAPNATIDVSGANIVLPVERNVVNVELRGSQLANSPNQQDGPLRSQSVAVDVRATGTRADGTTWVGTPLADLAGDVAAVGRTAQERSLTGGTVNLVSGGDLVLSNTSRVDVSGGSIQFLDGYVNTTQLLGVDGRIYDMANASADRSYLGIADAYTVTSERWGSTRVYRTYTSGPGRFEAGYLEGKDAGTIRVVAPRMVMDGSLVGQTVAGRYQRLPAGAVAASQLYRAFNQRPLGGQLLIGNGGAQSGDVVLGSVEFGDGLMLPTLLNALGNPFDPRRDRLGAAQSTLRLRPEMLRLGNMSRLRVDANDEIRLPATVLLDPGPGASIDLRAQSVVLDGSYRSAGGAFAASAVLGTRVGSTATIDVAGQWVNDNPLLGPRAGWDPLFIQGGSVALSGSTLRLDAGSVLDVSGGAARNGSGTLTYGNGGSIRMTATAPAATGGTAALQTAATLRGYAFRRGGSLSLGAWTMCVTTTDCAGAPASTYLVRPQQFNEGGFSTYSLNATNGGLRIAAGTVIAPLPRNRDFIADPSLLATGTSLDAVTRVVELPAELRSTTNLTFSVAANTVPTFGAPYTVSSFAGAGVLTMEAGASILATPRSSVAFNSNTRMLLDGLVQAPGGRITATLGTGLPASQFLPSQAIVLGSGARMDASGTSLIRVDSSGLRVGDVLAGGTVTLNALRGFVQVDQRATIDVSGTTGDIDVRAASGNSPAVYETKRVASAGGTINLTASEGIFLSGGLAARSGAPGVVSGGTVNITLDPRNRADLSTVPTYSPAGSRDIRVLDTPVSVSIQPGTAVPAGLWGTALVSAAGLTDSGADVIRLRAENTRSVVGASFDVLTGVGTITFVGSPRLDVRGRLQLDAPVLRSTGGVTALGASYVALGNTDRTDQAAGGDPTAGTGRLQVNARQIDLFGALNATGFGLIALNSQGDIRLIGVAATGQTAPVGSLRSTGDILLGAQQIVPVTLTDFTIASLGTTAMGGTITTTTVSGTPQTLLSAGGRIRLTASTIDHGGAIRAPFGNIELVATGNVLLRDGSVLSTSAEGRLIPFGVTQGGFDWAYALPNGITLVYGPDGRALPAQRVAVDAPQIDFRSGATVDVRGGGDLLAYEFVPGVTGTRDILSPLVRPEQFAILPTAALQFAAYDSAESLSFGLPIGTSLTIPAGVDGLPAGTYALLPARYALLPGAMLVTRVSGYANIAPGETFRALDGGLILAGQETYGGLLLGDSRYAGYSIQPGSLAREQARYDLSRASNFFGSDAATLAQLRLPRDAGTIVLLPRLELSLRGNLFASAADGGRGASLELAAERLRVVAAGTAPVAGEVAVSGADLARLGATSVLLGGQSTDVGGSRRIDVLSRTVVVDGGVTLSAPELLIAARDRITLANGATVTSSAAAAANFDRVSVSGDSALIRVAGGEQANLQRNAPLGVAGIVEIADGATIRSSGSVLLDASRDVLLRGQLALTDASLQLGASSIALGNAPAGRGGLVLSTAQLAALDIRELTLATPGYIDLFGNVDVSADSLQIASAGLRAGSAGTSTLRSSGDLELRGTTTALAAGAQLADTSVELRAAHIALAGGNFLFSGFASSRLNSDGDIVATSDGRLAAGGNLGLRAQRLIGDAGVAQDLIAAGNLAFESAPGAPDSAVEPGLGVRFTLAGASISGNGAIDAPGGFVTLTGTTGDVSLRNGARIDVSGRTREFDGVLVAAPGGTIEIVSQRGNVSLDAGATLDVSAAGSDDAVAGRLLVRAAVGNADLRGTLRGTSARSDVGAEAEIDAFSFGTLSSINALLNAGGFSGSRSVRLRGVGDLVLNANESLTARRVRLVADAGDVRIDGRIDASSAQGGSVMLAALRDVSISGSIDARALDAGGRGGRVDLASRDGMVRTAAGASIDVSPGATVAGEEAPRGGTVDVRVSRDQIESLVGSGTAPLAGRVRGHESLTVEGYAAYTDADGALTLDDVDPTVSVMYADATDFMAREADWLAALGLVSDLRARLLPGIEIVSTGNLTVVDEWDLSTWRFGANGDLPGVLSLRAGGDLQFAASLTDGFDVLDPTAYLVARGDSWSYRLVGGADFSSALPLATNVIMAPIGPRGSVFIQSGVPASAFDYPTAIAVRTGTGRIDVAAAGDFRLGNQASVLYTGGVDGGRGIVLENDGGLEARPYAERGGDISIDVRGNIQGARSSQLFTDWMWRTGGSGIGITTSDATGWTINHGRFQQNVAALAGGDVFIRAGGNIVDFSASTPSTGRQVGGTTNATSVVQVIGGGTLDVASGGSIVGGSYLVGRGTGLLRAGNSIGRSTTGAGPGLVAMAPVLALQDGSIRVFARDELGVESVLNPTLVPQGLSQSTNVQTLSFFSTYAADSRVELSASGGDLYLFNNDDGRLNRSFSSITVGQSDFVFELFPPILRAAALSRDLNLRGDLVLYPSGAGQLEMFAGRNVNLDAGTRGSQVIVSDADSRSLPTVARPTVPTFLPGLFAVSPAGGFNPGFTATTPTHLPGQPNVAPDGSAPARVVARTGDVFSSNAISVLFTAMPARVVAGRDIRDLDLLAQNLTSSSVTSLIAGRDITFTTGRAADGRVLTSDNQIRVQGPGLLQLLAGRDVDLQTSGGITTLGSTLNPVLGSGGANVSVLAGIGDEQIDYAAFTRVYLRDSTTYDALLIAYVARFGARPAATKAEALAQFAALDPGLQRGLLETVLFNEIRAGGRSAAQPGPGNQDFTRSFRALETMFPGSNPDPAKNETNRYSGDIRLFFSRIYTLDGGDISLIAPGGQVNVGLASPPISFGITKAPSELGIVAQRSGSIRSLSFDDFQVNESRAFAADGGDILVWATRGDIDAGRGAKTAISSPPPRVTIDPTTGLLRVEFPPALTGSGIQTLASSDGVKPGSVDLFAPRGVVNAGDAGIVAGNLTIAATAVLGADNIQVSGVSVGVPVDSGGLGAGLAGVSSVGSSATSAASAAVDGGAQARESKSPLADSAIGWLEVFIEGFGEEVCKPTDLECLKRNRPN